MQINIDFEQAGAVASQLADWFGGNPWRPAGAYAVAAWLLALRPARKYLRECYADIRAGRMKRDQPVELAAVYEPLLVLVTGPVWLPIYLAWRIFRAGLGPVPPGPE